MENSNEFLEIGSIKESADADINAEGTLEANAGVEFRSTSIDGIKDMEEGDGVEKVGNMEKANVELTAISINETGSIEENDSVDVGGSIGGGLLEERQATQVDEFFKSVLNPSDAINLSVRDVLLVKILLKNWAPLGLVNAVKKVHLKIKKNSLLVSEQILDETFMELLVDVNSFCEKFKKSEIQRKELYDKITDDFLRDKEENNEELKRVTDKSYQNLSSTEKFNQFLKHQFNLVSKNVIEQLGQGLEDLRNPTVYAARIPAGISGPPSLSSSTSSSKLASRSSSQNLSRASSLTPSELSNSANRKSISSSLALRSGGRTPTGVFTSLASSSANSISGGVRVSSSQNQSFGGSIGSGLNNTATSTRDTRVFVSNSNNEADLDKALNSMIDKNGKSYKEKLAKIKPAEEKVNGSIVPFNMTTFLSLVIAGKNFVQTESSKILNLSPQDIRDDHTKRTQIMNSLLGISQCGTTSSKKLEKAIIELLRNTNVTDLPNFAGQVEKVSTLYALRNVLKRKDFIQTLENVHTALQNDKTISNTIHQIIQKKVDQLKIMHEQAKDCDIDHLSVTIFRSIVSPNNVSPLSRSSKDGNIAIVVFKEANITRTFEEAITTKLSFTKDATLKKHYIEILKQSLSHDAFLSTLFRYHGQNTEEILSSFIYTGHYVCLLDIDNWIKRHGIPESISMLVFDLVFHIQRVSFLIDIEVTLARNTDPNVEGEKLSTAAKKFCINYTNQIEDLMGQKNTLDVWVKALYTTPNLAKAPALAAYENYINSEISDLISKLEKLQGDANSTVKEFVASCKVENKSKDIFDKFIAILKTNTSLFFTIPSTGFTPDFTSKLFIEFEKLAVNYKLHILSNTQTIRN